MRSGGTKPRKLPALEYCVSASAMGGTGRAIRSQVTSFRCVNAACRSAARGMCTIGNPRVPMPDTSGTSITPMPKTDNRIRVLLVLLVNEKVTQHLAVTVALIVDFGGIRASLALDYQFFLVAVAFEALLFALGGWGILRRRSRGGPDGTSGDRKTKTVCQAYSGHEFRTFAPLGLSLASLALATTAPSMKRSDRSG